MAVVFPFPQGLFHGGKATLEVTISTNQTDLDLWTYVNANYANASNYEVFNVTINSGVVISSSYSGGGQDAMIIGSANWPAGSEINITNNGTIAGAGGDGGYANNGGDGGYGDNAISCSRDCSITNASGAEISGGGGGGGGTNYYSYWYDQPIYAQSYLQGGGGGGAGRVAGAGGGYYNTGYYGGYATPGATGNATSAGDGGQCYYYAAHNMYYAGDGGGRGAAGGAGSGSYGGGAAGKAVAKNGNTVTVTNNGTIFGATS